MIRRIPSQFQMITAITILLTEDSKFSWGGSLILRHSFDSLFDKGQLFPVQGSSELHTVARKIEHTQNDVTSEPYTYLNGHGEFGKQCYQKTCFFFLLILGPSLTTSSSTRVTMSFVITTTGHPGLSLSSRDSWPMRKRFSHSSFNNSSVLKFRHVTYFRGFFISECWQLKSIWRKSLILWPHSPELCSDKTSKF